MSLDKENDRFKFGNLGIKGERLLLFKNLYDRAYVDMKILI